MGKAQKKGKDRQFIPPYGVVPLKRDNEEVIDLRTGFDFCPGEVTDKFAYKYVVSISAPTISDFFQAFALELMPPEAYLILVASNFDPTRQDPSEQVFLTGFQPTIVLLNALDPYLERLSHDGFVGFGLGYYDSEQHEEIYISPKKVISIFTSRSNAIEGFLKHRNIPFLPNMTFLTHYATRVSDLRTLAYLSPTPSPDSLARNT